jgi:hypothetical protein
VAVLLQQDKIELLFNQQVEQVVLVQQQKFQDLQQLTQVEAVVEVTVLNPFQVELVVVQVELEVVVQDQENKILLEVLQEQPTLVVEVAVVLNLIALVVAPIVELVAQV